MFGRSKSMPIPSILPRKCPKCGAPLHWTPVTVFDTVIGLEKVDYYKAECACGEVHYRDGRGQEVEPAVPNLAPDRSDYANSPQGPQPYSGYMEFVEQERAKAEALKAAQAKKAADAAAGADRPATPAGQGPPATADRPAATSAGPATPAEPPASPTAEAPEST
jgi:hypothetical protein